MKFIINGDPIDIAIDPHVPLRHGVLQALERSNNTGLPLEDWELRDERGRLLAIENNLVTYDWLKSADLLFVTRKIGAGG